MAGFFIKREGRIFGTVSGLPKEDCHQRLFVFGNLEEEMEYIREKQIRYLQVLNSDLSLLVGCDWIQSVGVGEMFTNLDAVAELPNLDDLFINDEVSKDVVHLERFKQIRELEVFLMRKNVGGVEELGQLEWLKLYGYAPPCRSFEALDHLTRLRFASFTRPRIDSVAGIHRWTELQELELCYARTLSDISELRECKKLKNLLLEASPHTMEDQFLLDMGFKRYMYDKRSPRRYLMEPLRK